MKNWLKALVLGVALTIGAWTQTSAVPIEAVITDIARRDVLSFGSLENALVQIGTRQFHLQVSTKQIIAANMTIPSNITLDFVCTFTECGELSPNSGVTVTINGPLEAPLRQVFGGAGTVIFTATSRLERLPVQWWGATGDGTTDDKTAIQAALDAAVSSGIRTVYFPGTLNKYKVESALSIGVGGLTIIGESPNLSVLSFEFTATDGGTTILIDSTGGFGNIVIKNMNITAENMTIPDTANTQVVLVNIEGGQRHHIERNSLKFTTNAFNNAVTKCLVMGPNVIAGPTVDSALWYSVIENNVFNFADVAVHLSGQNITDGHVGTNIISNNTILTNADKNVTTLADIVITAGIGVIVENNTFGQVRQSILFDGSFTTPEHVIRGNWFDAGAFGVTNPPAKPKAEATDRIHNRITVDSGNFMIASGNRNLPNSDILNNGNANSTYILAENSRGDLYTRDNIVRRILKRGTTLVAGDFAALHANWGSGASLSSILGSDQAFQADITTGATGLGADPTLVLTFSDGAWSTSPMYLSTLNGGTGGAASVDIWASASTTTLTLTFKGTPAASTTYTIRAVGIGG